MKYFSNCTTLHEVKQAFEKLIKQHRPDREKQEIKREYNTLTTSLTFTSKSFQEFLSR